MYPLYLRTASALAVILILRGIAWSATLYVDAQSPTCDNTAGAPYCNLQAAINAAADGDTILISSGTYTGEFTIAKSLAIQGMGDVQLVGYFGRVLSVTPAGTLALSNVTVTRGSLDGNGGGILNAGTLTLIDSTVISNSCGTMSSSCGGGIHNSGRLMLDRCTISHNSVAPLFDAQGGGIYCTGSSILIISNSAVCYNIANGGTSDHGHAGHAAGGGGIWSQGDVCLVNSTIAGNMASGGYALGYRGGDGLGGGVYSAGRLDIRHCTVAFNEAFTEAGLNDPPGLGRGGGICSLSSSITMLNTVIGSNKSGTDGPDIYGVVNSLGYNWIDGSNGCAITNMTSSVIVGLDSRLAPAGFYGGHTPTCPLRVDSPAIDRGSRMGGRPFDQRGSVRPMDFGGRADADDGSDIGAFEFDNGDADGDGTVNDWEVQHGLDPTNSGDASQDPDGDQLDNLAEFQNLTDPGNADTDGDAILDGEETVAGVDGFITNPRLADSDLDGAGDVWEMGHNFNPTNPADAAQDSDADGMANQQECGAGSDPWNPDTDGDSLIDGWEFANGHCLTDVHAGIPGVEIQLVSALLPSCWGSYQPWAIEVEGNTAYLAVGTNGLQIIDIADPAHPLLVGSHTTTTNYGWDVDVDDTRAYLASYREHRALLIFDVTDPAAAHVLGQLDITGGAVRIQVDFPMAYIISNSNVVNLVDIEDPVNPVVVGTYTPTSQPKDLAVLSNQLYIVCNDGFRIMDVSCPTNLVEIAFVAHTNMTYPTAIHLAGHRAYVSCFYSVHAFDVSDPANVHYIGASYTGGATQHATTYSNKMFVTGDYHWHVFDTLTNPIPYDVGGTNAEALGLSSQGWSRDSVVVGPYIFSARGGDGLVVLHYAEFDADADGLDDRWEWVQFGHTGNLPFGDADGDGISNWGEFLNDLCPTNADQDADGIADGWETRHLLNLANSDASADADGDGALNVDEFIADTDPQNAASRFQLDIGQGAMQDEVLLTFSSSVARRYCVQYSTNLLADTWQDVAPEASGNGSTLSVSSSAALPGVYYRAKVRKP